jgi:hypothetical protein
MAVLIPGIFSSLGFLAIRARDEFIMGSSQVGLNLNMHSRY